MQVEFVSGGRTLQDLVDNYLYLLQKTCSSMAASGAVPVAKRLERRRDRRGC